MATDLVQPVLAPDPLSLIPAGPKYTALRAMLKIMKRDFPRDYQGLTNQLDRVRGWVSEIDSGTGRSADDIRDDIVQHIITTEELMNVYGVDEETANQLQLGSNDGGLDFGEFLADRPGPTGQSPGEGEGEGDAPATQIFSSQSLQWFKDEKTGRWYVSYALPGGAGRIVFEAEEAQVRELFEGGLPTNFNTFSFDAYVRRERIYFGGDITEVFGEGNFEEEVQRTIALALDQQNLPDWIQDDPGALGLVYVMVTEDRSNEWLYAQLSNRASFKRRYPGLTSLVDELGMTVGEGVAAFTEFETKLKQLHAAAGFEPSAISPRVVGGLLEQGYNIEQTAESYSVWKRMRDHAPALQAFNEVLRANGMEELAGIGMYNFLMGTAPAEVYDLYEASFATEAARAAGIGADLFSGEDALTLAVETAEEFGVTESYERFSQVAQRMLRFRHELNVGQYGLEVDDLIDLSFGRAPRSGKSAAEVGEALSRITKQAEGFLQQKVAPFFGFTKSGRPQARSFGELTQVSV